MCTLLATEVRLIDQVIVIVGDEDTYGIMNSNFGDLVHSSFEGSCSFGLGKGWIEIRSGW